MTSTVLKPLLIITCISLLLLSACDDSPEQTITPALTVTPTPYQTPTPPMSPISYLPSVADVVEKVMPTVVYIQVEYLESSFFFNTVSTKSGSGVILSPNGHILTNNHVIADARKIEVLLPGNDQFYQAEMVGTDSVSDLAVIKIEGQGFPAAEFGDTSRLRVGDWVIALGNPLGSTLGPEGGPSVTMGIISSLNRSFPPIEEGESAFYDVIQTDTAINPGNSGGPLVNLEGKVVGINTFIFTTAQNIGFAVSASTAQRVYEDLVRYGEVSRPYLGITLRTMTPALATELGLPFNKGVLVWYIAPGSPAEKECFQTEDVITLFQSHEVSEATELIKLLWQYKVGDRVMLTLYRGDKQLEIWVTLAKRPDGV